MPDYSKSKIYCIRSHQTDQIYIGSTVDYLSKRMAKHRYDAKNRDDCSSKLILEHGDAYIELIEDFPCRNKEELNKREGEIIRSMNCVNKQVAGRTRQETIDAYKAANKEKIRERAKLWARKDRAAKKAQNLK